jgi:outer membrane protein
MRSRHSGGGRDPAAMAETRYAQAAKAMTKRGGKWAVRLACGLMAAMLAGAMPAHGQVAPRQVTLDQAVDLALDGNRDLQQSRLQLSGARQQVREAWGYVYPTLEMTANYTRNIAVPSSFLPRVFLDPTADPDELVAVRFGADNAWTFQLRAEQPLFQATAFIGVGAAARYAGLQREIVRGQAMRVATAATLAYYDVLLAEERTRLVENTVRRVEQTLTETRRMYEAGVSTSYDVLRLEVELANVEPNLRRARNLAAAGRRTLAVQIGLDAATELQVTGTLAELATGTRPVVLLDNGAEATDGILQEAIQLARANRSELRQLLLQGELQHAEVRAEQAGYLPRVALFGTYQVNAQQSGSPAFFGRSPAERAYGRQVGVQVTMPLFGGFKRPARVAQLQFERRRVDTQYEHTVELVENEVRTLLEQTLETRERREARSRALQQAQRGFDIARAQYREGISSALEVTDAESALRNSEFNYAEAIYEFLVAHARLESALGVMPKVEEITRAQ